MIKIASTWEGIQAARELERDDQIHCNLTLLFGFGQAVACAEAGVTLISPFVGRILDWYKAKNPSADYAGEKDPGVQSVTKIFNYYKQHGYSTIVMGASFRNVGVKEERRRNLEANIFLSRPEKSRPCRASTSSLSLPTSSRSSRTPASPFPKSSTPKLVCRHILVSYDRVLRLSFATAAKATDLPKLSFIDNEPEFRWELLREQMAFEKLHEGIRKFAEDGETLKSTLRAKLSS